MEIYFQEIFYMPQTEVSTTSLMNWKLDIETKRVTADTRPNTVVFDKENLFLLISSFPWLEKMGMFNNIGVSFLRI